MIHLAIRTYRHVGGDNSEEIEFGGIIHEHDITLGEALELVIGKMMEGVGNVGTTIQRTRGFSTGQDMEVALSHEYYLGPWPQNPETIPENWYAYWYSFTLPDSPSRRGLAHHDYDLQKLYNAVKVYYSYLEGSGAYLYASPEFQRQIEHLRSGSKPHSAAHAAK